MKYITKKPQPHELIAWTRAKPDSQDAKQLAWSYDDMPAAVREAIKAGLIQEQGGLCCYTGRRVTAESSHIEHLKPQALCMNHEDTDYANMLAAHPAWNAPKKCEYGAHKKGSWYDEHLLVHPLRPDCERRFRYRATGKISPAHPDDEGAKETIRRLHLDHRELVEMRKEAIHSILFEKQLSKVQAERLMANIEERNSHGLFRPFCFAIKQACEKYLKRFDARK